MFALIYFLSSLASLGVVAYLFYTIYKKNHHLQGEIEILSGLIKAQDKKSERRAVENTVKVVAVEKRMSDLEESVAKKIEHIEAQNGVLSQRITNMKKSVHQDEQ